MPQLDFIRKRKYKNFLKIIKFINGVVYVPLLFSIGSQFTFFFRRVLHQISSNLGLGRFTDCIFINRQFTEIVSKICLVFATFY